MNASIHPPQDGTVIIADFNLIEVDDFTTSVTGFKGKSVYWSEGLWLWAANHMSVLEFLGDDISFHWWTAVNPQPAEVA